MTLSHRAVGGSTSLRNWATLCALLLMGFLLYHDPLLLLSKPPKPPKPGGLALDMAADSIDDMYEGCRSEAASVIDLYGESVARTLLCYQHSASYSRRQTLLQL
ncbi:hypothetical protein Q5P01_026402 [Channa striata]|uniref:Uncharacterized protein n=1 Tax=Channa striata TaxID=64152 RepID=A0AA88IZU4_CHASR|nr:hypothetical protein Q5P01_026402 [Channa striata]